MPDIQTAEGERWRVSALRARCAARYARRTDPVPVPRLMEVAVNPVEQVQPAVRAARACQSQGASQGHAVTQPRSARRRETRSTCGRSSSAAAESGANAEGGSPRSLARKARRWAVAAARARTPGRTRSAPSGCPHSPSFAASPTEHDGCASLAHLIRHLHPHRASAPAAAEWPPPPDRWRTSTAPATHATRVSGGRCAGRWCAALHLHD